VIARLVVSLAAVGVLAAGCTAAHRSTPPPSAARSRSSTLPGLPPGVVPGIDRIAGHALVPGVGLSIAVESKGRVYTQGYGLADTERDTPVTAQTVFPIASVTKQFTAAGIMQLVEAHRLRLEQTLSQLLPDVAWRDRRARAVTVRQLLTHTSGIPGYTSVAAFAGLQARPQTPRTILSLVTGRTLKFDPGTQAAYSNTGYYLLGLIIERVAGMPYEQYLRQRLLAGLDVPRTGPCPEPGQARLYVGARTPAPPVSLVNAFAAGELCSTAADLLCWQDGLRSGRVVSAASYRQMTTPLRLADGRTVAYGFGLDLDPIGGRRAIDHEGGFPGATSDLVWYPDQDTAIAVLSNSSAVAAWTVSAQLAKLLLG
jgi:D-alanyl-D-alanine carboxypeptidase